MKPSYTLEEACEYLAADRTTVLDLIDRGEIIAAKIGRAWVMRGADLDAYLSETARRQTAERQARAIAGNVERSRSRNVSESQANGTRSQRRKPYPSLEALGQRAAA